jgi:hypothetical protein
MTTPPQQQVSKRPEATKGDYQLPDGRVVTWAALVRMLLGLQPTRCPDVGTVTAVFGDAKFKSLGQIAEAFSVHPSVVRSDWRSQGMPGSPEDGWPISELLTWHLRRVEDRSI